MREATDHDVLETLPAAEREKLATVLDEFVAALEQGRPVSIEDVVSRHPDLAAPIRLYAESLRVLCLAAPRPAGDRTGAVLPPLSGWNRELGDYRLLREIGRGGMGVVYEAEQLSLGRLVALKILPFAAVMDSRQLARFTNEARAAAQLNHPNIVPVYGVGSERGVHYYSMQYIEGRPLDRLIQDLAGRQAGDARRPTASTSPGHHATTRVEGGSGLNVSSPHDGDYYRGVALLGIQAADALQHAHDFGIIHRDIKPSNMLLDGSGKLWITDFGLARLPTDANLTMSGAVVGTARYMSPEQAAGRTHLVDHRTDVYALGITLYELLTLRPAFAGSGPQQVVRLTERDEPPPPRRLNPSIPGDLNAVILKAIGTERESRYQSAAALADDLRRFIDGRPTLARQPTLLDRIGKWTRRHTPLVAAAAAILFVGFVATAVAAWLVTVEKRQTAAALQQAERQLERAESNYKQARGVIDRYGLRLAEELAEIPGVERVRRELLEDSLRCYENLLEQSRGDSALEAERAATAFRAAEIAAELGDRRAAAAGYSSACDSFARLLEKHPGSAAFLSSLALCHNNLGLILAADGDAAGAGAAFRKAERLAEDACHDAPDDGTHGWRLALVLTNIGMVHADQGDRERADAWYGRAIAMLEGLVDREPHRDEFRRELAVAYNNRGALRRTAAPRQAADDNGLALRHYEALVQRHERFDDLSKWAVCLCNQGVLLAELGSRSDAIAALREAVATQERLSRKAPARIASRHDLAISCNNLGRVLLDAGSWDEADQVLRRAGEVLDELIADYPPTAEHWAGLGGIDNNRAAVQERRGDLVRAAELFDRAVERLQQACSLSGNAAEPRELLGQAMANRDRVLEALKHRTTAATWRDQVAVPTAAREEQTSP